MTASRPLYEQAVEAIEGYIRQRALPPGARLPSARELSAELGFNRAPVHQALLLLANQHRLKRSGKFFQVGQPRKGESKLIVCQSITGPRPQFIAALEKAGEECGIEFENHVFYSPEEELETLSRIQNAGPLLLANSEQVLPATNALLQTMAATGRPVVGCFNPPSNISAVLLDIHAATQQAFDHLIHHGHKHLAFLHRERVGAVLTPAAALAYRIACLASDMPASAARIFDVSLAHKELTFEGSTKQILSLIHLYQSEVTALICMEESTALEAISNAEKLGLKVPEDLSVISLQQGTRRDARSLTVCSSSAESIATMAVHLLRHQIADPNGIIRIAVEPMFNSGETTTSWKKRRAKALSPSISWTADTVSASPGLPPSSNQANAYFVDLSASATRSYSQAEKGWFGHYGLTQISPGYSELAGYPFCILDERQNGGRGAIVLRSARVQYHGRKKLPSRVLVPIHRKCCKVLILHAAGWICKHEKIGEYALIHANREKSLKPIVALHSDPPGSADAARWIAESSVQDWWPDLPQFNTSSVHSVMIGTDAQVYLYVLEWNNPFPAEVVEQIEFRSIPSKQATLGILAVTLVS